MSEIQQIDPVFRLWYQGLEEAADLDNWGQVEEAEEKYQYVYNQIKKELDKKQTQTHKTNVTNLMQIVETRLKEIKKNIDQGVGTQGIKIVLEAFPQIFGKTPEDFPQLNTSTPFLLQLSTNPEGKKNQPQSQDFQDPLEQTYLTLQIHKWGFKQTQIYFEPTVVISVVNKKGQLLEKQQQTPISSIRDVSYIHFNESISLKTSLENLEQGSAIFFEFKHYKTNKRKHSIKCYTYMELDEIKQGTLALESYKKPADFSRGKKPRLFTVKDLFFYVSIQMSREVRDPM